MRTSLRTADGVTLSARHRTGGDGAAAAVVLVHGFTATQTHPGVVAVADELARRGHGVVTYDARGHGDSEGLCTLGDHEALDVAAAVELARSAADRVVVVGASMGAVAALRALASGTAADGVVTVSAPADWSLRSPRSLLAGFITQTRLGRLGARRLLKVRLAVGWTGAEPPTALLGRITSPVAVVHGRRDRFIPASAAVSLHDHVRGPRRLELVEGMGHAFDIASVAPIAGAVDWALARSLDPVA